MPNTRPLNIMTRKLPKFDSEQAEQEFWAKADFADYVDWSKARRVTLPNLKPSTKAISLRRPEHLLDSLKVVANKRDVPYQSLLKMFLSKRIEAELRTGCENEPEKAV